MRILSTLLSLTHSVIHQKIFFLQRLKRRAQWGAYAFLNLLFPPRCFSCGTRTMGATGLCAPCWNQLDFIIDPLCQRCGFPFEMNLHSLFCGDCLHHPPLFSVGRSVLVYHSLGRDLILKLKHGDATHLAKILGGWMAMRGKECLAEADLLIPVPLHRWRLFWRRYNQATLMARHVSRLSRVPLCVGLLQRSRATSFQQGKSRQQRQRNVEGAFSVCLKRKALIQGKKIVLIDDVWTTGATLIACVKTLKKAGADQVSVLTVARVVKNRVVPQGGP